MERDRDRSKAVERRLARAAAATRPAIWDLDLATGEFTATPPLYDLLDKAADTPLDLAALAEATHPADRAWRDELAQPQHDIAIIGSTRIFRFRIVRADGGIRWVLMKVDIAYARSEGQLAPASYTGVVEDITEIYEIANALAESEERLKLAIEAGRMAVWEVDLETGALTPSSELNLLLGFPHDAVITLDQVRALYSPGEMERVAREGVIWETIKQRAAHGQSPAVRARGGAPEADRMQIQADIAITTPQGERKHLLLRAQHAPSLRGRGERVTGLLIDITERKTSEERLAVVARELQHRVKNSFAVVQTLAVQSFRNAASSEAGTQAFLGRLRALAVASDMILESDAAEAVLRNVVEAVIRPYRMDGVDPFQIDGDFVELKGRTTTAIGMALHELCTNAVKYGALSMPGGRVKLSWRLAGSDLVIDWAEEGGPAVLVPVRRGFGSRLLETVLAGESHGEVKTSYEPFGLRCRISLSLR